MIEKAEQHDQLQGEREAGARCSRSELLKRYTPYYNILTPYNQVLVNSKVRNIEIESSNTTMHRADAWVS